MKWRNLIFQMVVILLSYSNNRLVKNQFWVGTNWLAETQTMLSGSTNWERPTEEPARGSGGCGGDNGLSDNGRHSRLCPLLSTCVWGGQSSKASRPPTLSFTIQVDLHHNFQEHMFPNIQRSCSCKQSIRKWKKTPTTADIFVWMTSKWQLVCTS